MQLQRAAARPLQQQHRHQLLPPQQQLQQVLLLRRRRPAARAAAAAARRRSAAVVVVAAAAGGGGGSDGSVDDIMKKYGLSAADSNASPSATPARQPRRSTKAAAGAASAAPLASSTGNGVFLLLLANVVLFVLDHVLHLPGMAALYLYHDHPTWYQWVTHAFCHANWGHLSMNMFNLLVFGKMVEETEGAGGVVFAYVATALGAAAASVLAQPAVWHGAATVSLGASGAIFGLFAVSVLTRLSWDPRRLLEAVILGNFVVRQVFQEAAAQASGGLTVGGLQVGHVAHLAGAAAGVLLVWLLRALPDVPDGDA